MSFSLQAFSLLWHSFKDYFKGLLGRLKMKQLGILYPLLPLSMELGVPVKTQASGHGAPREQNAAP